MIALPKLLAVSDDEFAGDSYLEHISINTFP
jgi:hypothetical protein